MRKIVTTSVVVGGPVIGWLMLAAFANRNHIDFSAVAFPSAAAILAFLLPGAALVGPYIREELTSSSEQVQDLSDAAAARREDADKAAADVTTTPEDKQASEDKAQAAKEDYENLKAATKQELDKIFESASWLRTGLVYAFLAVPVAAVALVISPGDQTCWDWRAIVGAGAVTLLVGTGMGLVPITWRLLGLKLYRTWSDQAFR